MRVLLRAKVLIVCATVALGACGEEEREPGRSPPRVRVEITAPADRKTVRAATIDVRGSVSPRTADVRVLGRPARVIGGEFTVVVPLDPGVNVVDVAATARSRSASLTAFRVTREQRVTVPDLGDMELTELEAMLAPLGLRLQSESGGGLLDRLIPRPSRVCKQQPAPGAKVRRGSTIRVTIARSC